TEFKNNQNVHEHEAFIALWLSKYLFPSVKDTVLLDTFALAIHLARGRKMDLAHVVWVLERFPCVRPDHGMPDIQDDETRLARWAKVSKLVGLDKSQQYFPHRVHKQFGYNQDILADVIHLESNEDAWAHYATLLKNEYIYMPSRQFKGHVTVRESGISGQHVESAKVAKMENWQSDAFEALFGDENNHAVNNIAGNQEDPDVKDKQENQDDLNIAVPDQVLEESILYTSDKVEAVPTSMIATYEEHGCQESVSESGIYESGISGLVPQLRDANDKPYRDMLDATALKAKLNSLQLQVINNDDLGVITSRGGPSYHMQTSEKELAVFKSPLDQESMFRRQEGMLRRQEQQQLAKEAKIQRRL
nr:hypothetical protein [Tanacetum cinerariifolium]